MNFIYCILFCVAATTLVGCDDKYEFWDAQTIRDHREELFEDSYFWFNEHYRISMFAPKNVSEAQKYCNALYGYLAEIDDIKEYGAVQFFISFSSVKNLVIFGGSDATNEGTWIFPRTGEPMNFTDWDQNQPDNVGDEDCLGLWKPTGVKMNDTTCGSISPDDRFMCEIPVGFADSYFLYRR